jgi:hypothetical protein
VLDRRDRKNEIQKKSVIRSPEPTLAWLVIRRHGACPGTPVGYEDELDEEEEAGRCRGRPCNAEEGGEQPALEILVAPTEVAPVVRRHSRADDEECREGKQAEQRVREGVEVRVAVALIDGAHAMNLNRVSIYL